MFREFLGRTGLFLASPNTSVAGWLPEKDNNVLKYFIFALIIGTGTRNFNLDIVALIVEVFKILRHSAEPVFVAGLRR